MRDPIEIENIDELRLREGIDDVELREEVGRLHVGDHVHLTFVAGANPQAREVLVVRITRIHGGEFHGLLAGPPARADLARLRAGSRVVFTTGQIHSIARPRPAPGSHARKARH
jgi:hypothetical protein